jgi:hypothetical protein
VNKVATRRSACTGPSIKDDDDGDHVNYEVVTDVPNGFLFIIVLSNLVCQIK